MRRDNNMNICNRIVTYINRTYTSYALMIDGAWGCGKTYFVKHDLMKSLVNNEVSKKKMTDDYNAKTIVYMSLYGIESNNEILKRLWLEIMPIPNEITKENVAVGYLSNLSRAVIGGGLSFFNINLPDVNYDSILNLDNTVLIFDDVERCKIEIKSLLGFINNFVEHDGIKVILIGNQDELSNLNEAALQSNFYSLALDSRIKFPERSNEKMSVDDILANMMSNNEGVVDDSISINELKHRAEQLFEYKSDYERIKEKLIGITIKYQPDMYSNIESLIDKFVYSVESRKILRKYKNETIKVFEDNNHYNYRTLIFAFEKFDELYKKLISLSFNVDKTHFSAFIKSVYLYTLELSIKHKVGGYISDWSGTSEFGMVKTSDEKWSYDSIFGFKFVHDFVLYSSLNIDSIENAVKEYIDYNESVDATVERKIVILRNDWLKMSDNSLIKSVAEIDELIKNNKLNLFQLLEMLSMRMQANSIGFEFDIDEYVNLVRQVIRDSDKNKLQYDHHNRNYIPKELSEEFQRYKSLILNDFNAIQATSKVDYINSLFNGSTEGIVEFGKYVENSKLDFGNKGQFLSLIDQSRFVESIKVLDSVAIYLINDIISKVYGSYEFKYKFEAEKETITELVNKLRTIDLNEMSFDNIKTYNLRLLIEQLESYCIP